MASGWVVILTASGLLALTWPKESRLLTASRSTSFILFIPHRPSSLGQFEYPVSSSPFDLQSVSLFAIVTFYKVTAKAELENAEPLLLGETQG